MDEELWLNADIDWQNDNELYNDIFHELSHLANPRTHDDINGDDYSAAHQIEKLWEQDIKDWAVFRYDKKKALKDCCKKNETLKKKIIRN